MTMIAQERIDEIKNGKVFVQDNNDEIKLLLQTDNIDLEIRDEEEDTIQAEDFFNVMTEDLDEFEEKSWSKGNGYKTPKFPMISDKLEGLDSGLYLLPAESNAGKSAMMMNIVEDLVMCEENKLFGLYFSLDDSKHEIIPRVIAMREGIRIGTVAKPQRAKNMIDEGHEEADLLIDELAKREAGINNLKANSNKMMIVDSTKVRTLDDMKAYIQKLIEFYVTGDLKTFNEYCIAWVKDLDSRVDYVNGFTETYSDPLGITGTWESMVNFKDLAATKRTQLISENAQWFEDHSTTDPKYKKEEVKGVTAKVITADSVNI